MLRSVLLFLVLSTGIGVPFSATAQEQPPPAGTGDYAPFISLTFSPLHLIGPIFELTAEVRVGDYCGIAVLGGAGSLTRKTSDGDEFTFAVWELGGQVMAYPLEPFESLQLGVELQYAHVSTDDSLNGRSVSGTGAGFLVGPLVGYKLLTEVGFTLFVQGGVGFIAIEAEAEDGQGQSASAESRRVIPLLNFNIGWSF
jgi:hypothetical protein